MSWISNNYEKACLGGAAVLALGLGFTGWSKLGKVEQEFGSGLKGTGNNTTAVQNAELIPSTIASMKLERAWSQAADGDRPVNLFTGIPLFVASSAPDVPIDLLKDPDVHPPIKNIWWIENRLDPGYADSPERDPDEDGFSNLEEFLAGTDPNSAKSHPPLIAKLKYVSDEALTWVIRPSFGADGSFPLAYRDNQGNTNRATAANMIAPGELFFAEGTMAKRFKLLGSEERQEHNPRTNVERNVTIVRIEDQRPNKKGTIYEFPSPLNEDRVNAFAQYDRTAVLSLEALGMGGTEFKVEENVRFALPSTASKKEYLLKTVSPEAVIVEYTDAAGETKTVEITKGKLPQMDD
jgi:hypothetical protein